MNRIEALAKHLELEPIETDADLSEYDLDSDDPRYPELTESRYDSNRIEYGQNEYIVVDEDTADQLWDEELDRYLDECVLPELPETAQMYFDTESWKRDARMDGRGHALAAYDGDENQVGDWLIFRIN